MAPEITPQKIVERLVERGRVKGWTVGLVSQGVYKGDVCVFTAFATVGFQTWILGGSSASHVERPRGEEGSRENCA